MTDAMTRPAPTWVEHFDHLQARIDEGAALVVAEAEISHGAWQAITGTTGAETDRRIVEARKALVTLWEAVQELKGARFALSEAQRAYEAEMGEG